MAILTLEERQKQQRALADTQLSAAANQRKKDDAAALQTAYGELDKQVQQATDSYREQQQQATEDAQRLFEKHALEEELDKQAVDLRMANLGLQNSGLAAVSGQAATAHRAYKDKHNQRQLADYVEELTRAIADATQQGKDKKAALRQKSDADFNNWYAALAQKTYANADKTANTLYNADVKEQQKAEKENKTQNTTKKPAVTQKDEDTQQNPDTAPQEPPKQNADNTVSDANIQMALATVHTWNAASGGIFNKTFWLGTNGDGENVYEDVVEEQLMQSRIYTQLNAEERNRTIATALGKSVALTWPDKIDAAGNTERLLAALAMAQKQHGWDYETTQRMTALADATLASVQSGLRRESKKQ